MVKMWPKQYSAKSKAANIVKQAAEEAAMNNPSDDENLNDKSLNDENLTEDVGEVANTTNTPAVMSEEMRRIYERLDRLEKENDELKRNQEGVANVFVDWKKFYEWPRKFSYKLWWWRPVLSYKSFKKDPTKDLVYKDKFWQRTSNHYLKLQLLWDEEVEVEVNEFNKYYVNSEKMFAEKCTDNRWHLLWYEFDTEEFGKFIVAENIIN